MTIDGRLKKLSEKPRLQLPAKPCRNCRKLSKPLRNGLCHTCHEYYRRNGKDRPDLVDDSHVITASIKKFILAKRNDGLSYRAIASLIGLKPGSVYNIIRKSAECHKAEHAKDESGWKGDYAHNKEEKKTDGSERTEHTDPTPDQQQTP